MKTTISAADFFAILFDLSLSHSTRAYSGKGIIEEDGSHLKVSFSYFFADQFLIIKNALGNTIFKGRVTSKAQLRKVFLKGAKHHKELFTLLSDWPSNDKNRVDPQQKTILEWRKGYARQKQLKGEKKSSKCRLKGKPFSRWTLLQRSRLLESILEEELPPNNTSAVEKVPEHQPLGVFHMTPEAEALSPSPITVEEDKTMTSDPIAEEIADLFEENNPPFIPPSSSFSNYLYGGVAKEEIRAYYSGDDNYAVTKMNQQ